MMMKRSLSVLLSCLFLAVAVATTESDNAAKVQAPMVRVRRELFNVKQQQSDELHRLNAEFGEGGLRALQAEDMVARMLEGHLSLSYMSMSMSMSMSM
jgi:hypothetical protein